jgi:hypothetical protein
MILMIILLFVIIYLNTAKRNSINQENQEQERKHPISGLKPKTR